jgi:hypothetical protein
LLSVARAACGLIIKSQGHDQMKAHEKQLIIGMYLDLTPLQKNIQFKLIVTGPSVGQADLKFFSKLEILRSPSQCVLRLIIESL